MALFESQSSEIRMMGSSTRTDHPSSRIEEALLLKMNKRLTCFVALSQLLLPAFIP